VTALHPLLLPLRKIGWLLWDPIGLAGDLLDHREAVADEYDEYVLHVAAQLDSGVDEKACVRYLIYVETNDMGLRRPDAAERATLTVRAIAQHLAADMRA